MSRSVNDQPALAKAVAEYLNTGMTPAHDWPAADIDLEAALLKYGVMSPDEAIESVDAPVNIVMGREVQTLVIVFDSSDKPVTIQMDGSLS